jgi:hypothetical protein
MMAISSSIALALRLHAPQGSERALVGNRPAQIGKVLEAIALTSTRFQPLSWTTLSSIARSVEPTSRRA